MTMPNEILLFERNQVFIRERSSQSETRATPLDEITGKITVVENERGKLFRFIPLGLEDAMTDEWALINGGHSFVYNHNDASQSNERHSSVEFVVIEIRVVFFSMIRYNNSQFESTIEISLSVQFA
jgi:hypothetical protein